MAACGVNQPDVCDECVQVVRNIKTVQVPCTKKKCKKYTVKVPRQVTEQVPRTVQYTDFESRQKQVPYTDYRSERRTRMETQNYQVPVTTTKTRMVPVTKKVPKTVYVDVTTQVPKTYQKMTMQTKERQVPVPYYVNVPQTKYRTVMEQVPVQKSKVQMDTVVKTVYDTKVRTRVVPETKIVTKQIPVYNVIARPPQNGDGSIMADFNRIDKNQDGMLSYDEIAFDVADKNKDSQISFGEYADARAAGNLAQTSGVLQVGSGQISGIMQEASGQIGVLQEASGQIPLASVSNTIAQTSYADGGGNDFNVNMGADETNGQAFISGGTGYNNIANGFSAVAENSMTNGAYISNAATNDLNGNDLSYTPQYTLDERLPNVESNRQMQWKLCYDNGSDYMNGAQTENNGRTAWFRCLK